MWNTLEADEQPRSISNQQFGVSIFYIKNLNYNMVDGIPPVMRQCVEYLSTPEALKSKDTFHISLNPRVIREMQGMCNSGEEIIFENNPHDAAALLKTFLRELEEPLLTFDLYEQIVNWKSRSAAISAKKVKTIVLKKLPNDNYVILKYLINYLCKVKEQSSLNNMDFVNLAVVFGPTLAWPFIGTRTLYDIFECWSDEVDGLRFCEIGAFDPCITKGMTSLNVHKQPVCSHTKSLHIFNLHYFEYEPMSFNVY